MGDDYDEFELQAGMIREENAILLDGFRRLLEADGLKAKTIRRHTENIDFYINAYLLYDGLNHAVDGIDAMHGFFDWFFPRKAMWSGAAAVRENVASLKKFYKFMAEAGLVTAADYVQLLHEVKEGLPEWMAHYKNEGEDGW
jgi:site-specific recombinase XerD